MKDKHIITKKLKLRDVHSRMSENQAEHFYIIISSSSHYLSLSRKIIIIVVIVIVYD